MTCDMSSPVQTTQPDLLYVSDQTWRPQATYCRWFMAMTHRTNVTPPLIVVSFNNSNHATANYRSNYCLKETISRLYSSNKTSWLSSTGSFHLKLTDFWVLSQNLCEIVTSWKTIATLTPFSVASETKSSQRPIHIGCARRKFWFEPRSGDGLIHNNNTTRPYGWPTSIQNHHRTS